jgi:hypothetical protein
MWLSAVLLYLCTNRHETEGKGFLCGKKDGMAPVVLGTSGHIFHALMPYLFDLLKSEGSPAVAYSPFHPISRVKGA